MVETVFGPDTLERLGTIASGLGFRRTLLVADPGMVAFGYVARATRLLHDAGVAVTGFHAFDANPDSRMVEAGRTVGAAVEIDSVVALGGGSSLDCAKGINFLVTNGGVMSDYRGYGKAGRPLLPAIGVPTTAGTGSDAQSYAIISDADTHAKMACGDASASFRVVILDPTLTITQPRLVTAIAGYDALSHAVESFVTTKRNASSDALARSAWRRLAGHYRRVLDEPADVEARGEMLLGAHEAGAAIEQSMLGATHACANPLTAKYGTTHGVAIGVMLPHVVRWNGEAVGDRYAELLALAGFAAAGAPGDALADELADLARAGMLPSTLRELGVHAADFGALAADAATQWTGTFNPRPFDAAAALILYRHAY